MRGGRGHHFFGSYIIEIICPIQATLSVPVFGSYNVEIICQILGTSGPISDLEEGLFLALMIEKVIYQIWGTLLQVCDWAHSVCSNNIEIKNAKMLEFFYVSSTT